MIGHVNVIQTNVLGERGTLLNRQLQKGDILPYFADPKLFYKDWMKIEYNRKCLENGC